MKSQKILDDLEMMFQDSDMKIERGPNSISFIKDLSALDTGMDAYMWKGSPNYRWDLYSHTVKILKEGTYEATDRFYTRRGRSYLKGRIKKDYYNKGALVWSTSDIQKPIRSYMESIGYVAKEPFWTGKRIAIAFAAIWIPIIIAAIILFLFI